MEHTREWFEKHRNLYVYKLEQPCANCPNKPIHLHHIVDLAKGGTNLDSNIIQLCEPCHERVHNTKFPKRPKKTFKDLHEDFFYYYDMWACGKINKREFMEALDIKTYKTLNKGIRLVEIEIERILAEQDKEKLKGY